MKKLILLTLLIVGWVFADTIVYKSGSKNRTIENVEYIKAVNGKVYFKAHGGEVSRVCSKVVTFTDNDGNPIDYDCSRTFVEPIKQQSSKSKYSFRERWSYSEPKDPFKSGMLSAIIPSGGHFYNEEYYKGVKYLFGVPILYSVGSLIELNNIENNDDSGVIAGRLVQFSALFLHFYNVYNAIISSNNINKAYYDEYLENQQKKVDPN